MLAGFARQFNPLALPKAGYRIGLTSLLLLAGAGSVHDATALNETRTLSFHHTHSDEDLTVTFKRDGRYDEEALKKLNHFLRDWRSQDSDHDGSASVRHPLGSLPRRRRQEADPDHLRLPLPRHQRHAPPPLFRRGALQPAHARPRDGLLHPGRAARANPRRRPPPAAWRRRLLPDLGLALRPSRHRQRPSLAAHDPRSARQGVPGRPHRPPALQWRSAEGL